MLRAQLLCAAYERPLDAVDLDRFTLRGSSVAAEMVEAGELAESSGRLYYPSHLAGG